MEGEFSFWVLAVLLPMSMTAVSLITSQIDEEDWRQLTSFSRGYLAIIGLGVATIVAGLIFVPGFFLQVVVGLLILGLLVAWFGVFSLSRHSSLRQWTAFLVGALAVAASWTLLAMFDGSEAEYPNRLVFLNIMSIVGFLLGITALAVSCPEREQRRAAGVVLASMIGLVVVMFILWQQAAIELGLAKTGAVVLTLIAAFVLNRYMRRQTFDSGEVICRRCIQPTDPLYPECINCGFSIRDDPGTR